MSTHLPLQPEDLGLILSYHCQGACQHCLYNCSPSWKDWMAPQDVHQALQVAQAWPGVQVHLTGGEPFLNFPLLEFAVKTAEEFGVLCYVETNAGWCVRSDLVYRRFSRLRELGLAAILISCSPFHAETIPLHRTLVAIDIALQIFGPQRVMVYLPDWIEQILRFGSHDPVPLHNYIEAYGADPAGLMFWKGYGLISGGRAGYRLGYLTQRRKARSFQKDNCRSDLLYNSHSHFDLYGNLISGTCGGLRLGDWHNLPQLLTEMRAGRFPPLLRILVESGPYGLFRMAADEYGYRPLPGGYAGKCHLCVDVRLHLARTGEFIELQPAGYYAPENFAELL